MRSLSRPRTGQALVEFAIIAKVFVLLMFVLTQFGLMAWNRQAMVRAAHAGAAMTSGVMWALSAEMGNDSRLVTPHYSGLNDDLFKGAACLGDRKRLNRTLRFRGWDGRGCIHSIAEVAAPLAEGIAATRAGLGMFIGNRNAVTIRACYLVVTGDDLESESLCYASVDHPDDDKGEVLSRMTPDASLLDYAPTYVSVEITAQGMTVGNLPAPAFSVRRVELLDRFIPSCPAPETAAEWRSQASLNCAGIL